MKYKSIAAVLALLLVAVSSQAQPKTIKLVIEGGKEDYQNVPVCVPLSLAGKAEEQNVVIKDESGKTFQGQLTKPGLTTEHIKPKKNDEVRRDLHFILPAVKAGSTVTLECTFGVKLNPVPAGFFAWAVKGDGTATALKYLKANNVRPILQYMHAPYDDSSEEARNKSYKVFHHLYDPAGTRFVTNGGQTDPPTGDKLLFPHHRGIMYGFNKVTYGENKKADTWHCQKDDYLEHVKVLSQEAGPVLGRHRVLIDWHGAKEDIFAKEERELTVYNIPGGTLVEFASLLKTTGGKVKLDGDPQHAGFQFRAANEVAAKTAKQTYYLRVDGKGKPGETINWEPKKAVNDKRTIDVPWKAMSFVLGDKRYTVAYLDHPKNPGEARHSERDYGRFGYYFEYELTEQNPLLVNYRLFLKGGEMTGEQVEALHREFVAPPTVTVK